MSDLQCRQYGSDLARLCETSNFIQCITKFSFGSHIPESCSIQSEADAQDRACCRSKCTSKLARSFDSWERVVGPPSTRQARTMRPYGWHSRFEFGRNWMSGSGSGWRKGWNDRDGAKTRLRPRDRRGTSRVVVPTYIRSATAFDNKLLTRLVTGD